MTKKNKTSGSPFHISLRYKLTFPILVFVSLMIFLLFRTTFQLVRELVMDRNQKRLEAVAEIFAETVKLPIILGNERNLAMHIEWLARRPGIFEVQVEGLNGKVLGRGHPSMELPGEVRSPDFLGFKRIAPDTYAVAVPIQDPNRKMGRVLVLFYQLHFEEDLREIFQQKLMIAFIMLALLGMIITGVSWLAIRPLFNLKRTVQQILAGDLTARASTASFDEISDLAEAFNEMVSRLATSFDRLHSRTEALKESEEKYRLIVEGASDVIWSCTAEGDLTLLNKGFFGNTREDLLKGGVPLMVALQTPGSRKNFLETLKTIHEKKESITNVAVTHLDPATETEIYYLANLTPILDFEGKVKQIQGVMRDLTEYHRIEVMRESLIRDVAHELKTPVAKFQMTLSWFEKELEHHPERGKYHDVLGILNSNVDQLMRTIASVMDLSKLEAGIDRATKTELNLNEVLSQVFLDMQPMVIDKKLTFECDLEPTPIPMKGDKMMLQRLFANLVVNAVNFTEVGKITLTSRRENGHASVTVEDTGLGIEKKDLEIVFESFVQKTASTKGIGVGLTICRNIARLHGGKIWAESQGLGKGTTFKVDFPIGTG